MGVGILYHDGWFFEWSDNSDMPVSQAMTREEYEAYYREEFGRRGMEELPKRLERAMKTGSSFYGQTIENTIFINHAGERGRRLKLKQIMKLVIGWRDEKGEEENEPV